MWYTNKKGILERCGKNEKDVRWLDRAIKKGLVIHDLDMGYISVRDYIEELEIRIEELKKWEKSDVVERVDSKEVNELKERLGYVWGRLDMANKCIATMLDSYKEKLNWTAEKFYAKVWYKEDGEEASERQRAAENWII